MRPERPLALASIACAVVAAIAVFLPWYETSMTTTAGSGGGGADAFFQQAGSANGTQAPFLGTAILILTATGIFGAALAATGRDDLVGMHRPQTAVLSALLFGIATILAFVDLTKDVGGGQIDMGNVKVEAGKAIGVYVTTATALLATIAAAAAARIAARTTDEPPAPTRP